MKQFWCASIFIYAFVLCLNAQHSKPDTLEALRINTKINFDGNPNDSVWQAGECIINFTKRELNFGQLASKKTETTILYDNNSLYIGVWCYQKNPEKIVAKNMSRDFDYESDDVFGVLISPFNDRRNGYLFIINPNVARVDLQVFTTKIDVSLFAQWSSLDDLVRMHSMPQATSIYRRKTM